MHRSVIGATLLFKIEKWIDHTQEELKNDPVLEEIQDLPHEADVILDNCWHSCFADRLKDITRPKHQAYCEKLVNMCITRQIEPDTLEVWLFPINVHKLAQNGQECSPSLRLT